MQNLNAGGRWFVAGKCDVRNSSLLGGGRKDRHYTLARRIVMDGGRMMGRVRIAGVGAVIVERAGTRIVVVVRGCLGLDLVEY